MATAPVLDLDSLVAPISDEAPTGEDLRADASPTSIYYQLKDARSSARAAERQSAAEGESGSVPDQWRVILDKAPAVLAERSKDLEIAAWLIEALVRFHGFAGLRDGFRLITALVGAHWAGLYPVEDEDGLETKIAPLTGLNGEGADGTLIMPIRQIPLTEPGDTGPLAYWHYQQADAVGRIADEDKRQARIDAGAITVDQFNAAVNATSPGFYQRLFEDAAEATAAFAEMEAVLNELCGADGPPTGAIRSSMSDVIDLVRYAARDRMPVAAAEPEAAGDAAQAPAAGGGGEAAAAAPRGGSDVIANREDAFRLILKAAEFFRRNEPHSPIAYTLEDLVRRGRMSLHELLIELLPDGDARRGFLTAAGIKPRADGGEE
ncbi:MAG: type VI secretion system protein TssA [Alphaproteobacteria bacterium]